MGREKGDGGMEGVVKEGYEIEGMGHILLCWVVLSLSSPSLFLSVAHGEGCSACCYMLITPVCLFACNLFVFPHR